MMQEKVEVFYHSIRVYLQGKTTYKSKIVVFRHSINKLCLFLCEFTSTAGRRGESKPTETKY